MNLIQSSTGDKNKPRHLLKGAMWAWVRTSGSAMGVGQDMIITPVIEATKMVATLLLLLPMVATGMVVHHHTRNANQLGDEMTEAYHHDHRLVILPLTAEDQTNMVTDPDPKI